jgi:hypothetical protein
MKQFIIGVCLALLLISPALGVEEIAKDWGVLTKLTNGATIDVPFALTTEKSASGFFANGGFKEETAKATEQSRKLLRELWDIPEVANMRFSTWQILLIKPRLVVWDDKTYNTIERAMTIWFNAVSAKDR